MLLLKKILKINLDVPTPWGIYFQDSATPAKWPGNSFKRGKNYQTPGTS